jgi:DNA-directed RNA polymerase subunit RPC12/RpoP
MGVRLQATIALGKDGNEISVAPLVTAPSIRAGVAPEDPAATEKIIELAGHGMRGATLHATAAKAVAAELLKGQGMSNIQNAEVTLKCTKCGHLVPPPSESTSDETLVICPACGADLGTWGEAKKALRR